MNTTALSANETPSQSDIDLVEDQIAQFESSIEAEERTRLFEGPLTELARELASRLDQSKDPEWAHLLGRIITVTSMMAAEDVTSIVDELTEDVSGSWLLRSAVDASDYHVRMLGSGNWDVPVEDKGCRLVYRVDTVWPGSRFKRYEGNLEVRNAQDALLATFRASTGGYRAHYTQVKGPTPPGRYRVSYYRSRTVSAMILDDVGYSYNVEVIDGTPTHGRSALRIHPDGPPDGTHGCIGVLGRAPVQRDFVRGCNQALAEAADANQPLRLAVVYALPPAQR